MAEQERVLVRRLFDTARRWLGGGRVFRAFSLYPPFLGAGVRVTRVDRDVTTIDVEMPLLPWTRNYFGTHFGGSLYAMCDPFYVLILAENLGPRYAVWDKRAAIRFLKAGRGRVHARFQVPPERLEEIRRAVEVQGKTEPVFVIQVLDDAGQVVCEVTKTLHVSLRRA